MFSGVVRGVGCTRTCAQAAKTLANAVAGTVCVVDANFEAPSLDHHISPSSGPGLSDAILESKPGKDYAECIADSNLWMLVAGRQVTRVNGFSKGATPAGSRTRTAPSPARPTENASDPELNDGPSTSR